MVKLFVEGGGDIAALKQACRAGFKSFLVTAGLTSLPRIISCGTRRNAYDQFCQAMELGEAAFLLVDSEARVVVEHQAGEADTWHPWQHLKARPGDSWDRPTGAGDRHCHLMVQCMENWFIADRAALAAYFGQGFAANALPKRADVENVSKQDLFNGLAKATKACKRKPPYDKGAHSFQILSLIDPALVVDASPWAKRLIDGLKRAL